MEGVALACWFVEDPAECNLHNYLLRDKFCLGDLAKIILNISLFDACEPILLDLVGH